MAKTLASTWANNANLTDLSSGRKIQGTDLPGKWPQRNHLTYSRAGQISGYLTWRVGVVSEASAHTVKAIVATYDDGRGSGCLGDPTREHGGARTLRFSAFCRNTEFDIKCAVPNSATITTLTGPAETSGTLQWVHATVTIPAGIQLITVEASRDDATDGIYYQLAWREVILEAGDL